VVGCGLNSRLCLDGIAGDKRGCFGHSSVHWRTQHRPSDQHARLRHCPWSECLWNLASKSSLPMGCTCHGDTPYFLPHDSKLAGERGGNNCEPDYRRHRLCQPTTIYIRTKGGTSSLAQHLFCTEEESNETNRSTDFLPLHEPHLE
jgi:hypothetical protein